METTVPSNESLRLGPFSKLEFLLKEKNASKESKFVHLRAVPNGMENHFYHNMWAPLSVTIFITHVPMLRNGPVSLIHYILLLPLQGFRVVLHYRARIYPCWIRVESALKTHVIRISFPTQISNVQSKFTISMRVELQHNAVTCLTNRYAMHINAVQRTIRVKTHCWTANQKGLSVLPNPLHANQWLFYKQNQARNATLSQLNALSFPFLLCVSMTLIYFCPLLRDISCQLFSHPMLFV